MIRVFIVDDQLLVRQGLRALLAFADDVEVVGEAGDGDEAFRLIRQTMPDVALLDVRMPRASGIEVLEALSHLNARPAVILLTTFDDAHVLQAGVRLGARGYLLKDVSFDQLIGTIRAVAAGENRMAVLSEKLIERIQTQSPVDDPDAAADLTAREEDILRLISAGLSNREIAQTLKLSEGTVKNRVSDILLKLRVRDRTQAVIKAARMDIF